MRIERLFSLLLIERYSFPLQMGVVEGKGGGGGGSDGGAKWGTGGHSSVSFVGIAWLCSNGVSEGDRMKRCGGRRIFT